MMTTRHATFNMVLAIQFACLSAVYCLVAGSKADELFGSTSAPLLPPLELDATSSASSAPVRIEPVPTESRPAPLEMMSYESRSAAAPDQLVAGKPSLAPNQGPQFVVEASKNVTALAGRVASLTCRIKNLDNWTVSWIRHRDVSLLTVASYTYSADQRFRAAHRPYFGDAGGQLNSDPDSLTDTYQDWGLEIHSSQPRDSGIYECQISTTPHRSLFVHLRVVEPSTSVLGGSEVFVGMGSTINLTCVIRLSPEPPNTIRWQHNNQMIGYDSSRGGVSVVTEKGVESSSSLLIQNARPSDSGKYTCRPDNAEPATVNVHVLNGESPAAMQHGCSARQLSSAALFLFSVAGAVAVNVKAQRHVWSFIYGVT